MRTVLFYSGVDSFNYFTDQIEQELKIRGFETFILDLRNPEDSDPHSYANFNHFAKEKIDLVICYDRFGFKDDVFIEFWDANDATVVNILMDHPLRFHETMKHHPKKYIQLCCDENHVEYVKRYFAREIPNVGFLPHAGTLPKDDTMIPWEERKYDILFSGTYYTPQQQFENLSRVVPIDSGAYRMMQQVYELQKSNYDLTPEQSVEMIIAQAGLNFSEEQLRDVMPLAEYTDWAIRMYMREMVVETIANAGFDIYLLGRGWENHPSAMLPNVHRLDDRVPFEATLGYMANAKINLNVMPWFKAGTHDRVFNILLQHSLPLTDSSKWFDKHFTQNQDIVVYDLKELEKLPIIINEYINNESRAMRVISSGYDKVSKNYTWKNLVNMLLNFIS